MPVEHERLAATCTGPRAERVRPSLLDLLPLHLQSKRLEQLDHEPRRRLLVAGEARHVDELRGSLDQPFAVDAHHASKPPMRSPASMPGATSCAARSKEG